MEKKKKVGGGGEKKKKHKETTVSAEHNGRKTRYMPVFTFLVLSLGAGYITTEKCDLEPEADLEPFC